MKISNKLLISFVVITLLMAIVGTVTLVQNGNTKTSATEELYDVVQNLDYAWFLIESQQCQEIAAKDYVFLGKEDSKADYFEEKERAEKYYNDYYPGASDYVKSLLIKYDESIQQYYLATEEAFALYEEGADSTSIISKVRDADEYMESASDDALRPIIQYVHAEQLQPAKENIEDDIDTTTLTIIISSVLAVLLVIGIGFYISMTIVDPITKLKKATIELGKGNLNTSIHVKSKDEIGDLAKSFNQMVIDLKETTASRDELEAEVSQRKEVQEALQREKTNLHNILENSGDGIIIVDRNETVRFVNPAARVLFGEAAEELPGNLFGLPVVAGETTEIDIVCESGETGTGEMRVTETDWEGENAYLASIRDVTARKRTEEELRASKLQLQETLDQFKDSRE